MPLFCEQVIFSSSPSVDGAEWLEGSIGKFSLFHFFEYFLTSLYQEFHGRVELTEGHYLPLPMLGRV